MWSELQALKVGWLSQSKKSCHGQSLKNECSSFDYPSKFEGLLLTLQARLFQTVFVLCFSKVIFLFLIKVLMLKAIEIEIAFFNSLGTPKGRVAR